MAGTDPRITSGSGHGGCGQDGPRIGRTVPAAYSIGREIRFRVRCCSSLEWGIFPRKTGDTFASDALADPDAQDPGDLVHVLVAASADVDDHQVVLRLVRGDLRHL